MISERLNAIRNELSPDVNLVAVSKFHPVEAILEAYRAGHRVFGESRPQEFAAKVPALPSDIKWHFIGHLQTNKLKMVLPYVSMVQSVDSLRLLEAIDRWGAANGRVIPVLLELHLGAEETKQGFHEEEILDILFDVAGSGGRKYPNVRICGLMGMATNTDDEETIRADFSRISGFNGYIRELFPELKDFKELSIGMSADWRLALEYGATIIRVGTAVFGERVY